MTCLNSVDTGYAANQIYNAATGVFVAANCIMNPNLKDLRDMTLHFSQALLRRDGHFGIKIDSLNIDIKLLSFPHAKRVMDVANLARIVELVIDSPTSALPIGVQIADLYNHSLNLWATKSVGEPDTKKA